MLTGNIKMPPHSPTPEEAEHVVFFIRWWAELLGGTIAVLTGLFLKAKGRGTETVIIPMSEEEIEHRMTICKQSILLAIHEIMENHDVKLDAKLDHRDEMFLTKIETLHIRLNKEGK